MAKRRQHSVYTRRGITFSPYAAGLVYRSERRHRVGVIVGVEQVGVDRQRRHIGRVTEDLRHRPFGANRRAEVANAR